jgi:SAM-dependent methyltransferase
MSGVPDHAFDFVYSSHCLEHLEDVPCALRNWVRLVKPGGWLYIIVPDYVLYERLSWPSRFNSDHKATFSLDIPRRKVRRSNHWHVGDDVVPLVGALDMRVELLRLEDEGFDYSDGATDQTLGAAVAQICMIFQRDGVSAGRR